MAKKKSTSIGRRKFPLFLLVYFLSFSIPCLCPPFLRALLCFLLSFFFYLAWLAEAAGKIKKSRGDGIVPIPERSRLLARLTLLINANRGPGTSTRNSFFLFAPYFIIIIFFFFSYFFAIFRLPLLFLSLSPNVAWIFFPEIHCKSWVK